MNEGAKVRTFIADYLREPPGKRPTTKYEWERPGARGPGEPGSEHDGGTSYQSLCAEEEVRTPKAKPNWGKKEVIAAELS